MLRTPNLHKLLRQVPLCGRVLASTCNENNGVAQETKVKMLTQ